jgi:hypothetical protein
VTVEYEGAPARGWIIDLRGNRLAPFDGSVDLRPWEICTSSSTNRRQYTRYRRAK